MSAIPGSVPLVRAHPWHGVEPGAADGPLLAYVEIVPGDPVKYELDKETGLLRVDRPQRFSSACPTLYGFLPRTYCGDATARLCMEATGLTGVVGDGDPLDVCVLSEKAFSHGDFLLRCIPVGGLRMIDGGEADDKIVAVLEGDAVYGGVHELSELPLAIVDRLRHYFLTYKQIPGEQAAKVAIAEVYGRDAAMAVLRASFADYAALVAG